ncbi:hypothetical protein NQZ68_012571 [Dissostichus eleginoides]|nr:hypothetical protein NQZ68_012571 [Dissostichus eleginoides]
MRGGVPLIRAVAQLLILSSLLFRQRSCLVLISIDLSLSVWWRCPVLKVTSLSPLWPRSLQEGDEDVVVQSKAVLEGRLQNSEMLVNIEAHSTQSHI